MNNTDKFNRRRSWITGLRLNLFQRQSATKGCIVNCSKRTNSVAKPTKNNLCEELTHYKSRFPSTNGSRTRRNKLWMTFTIGIGNFGLDQFPNYRSSSCSTRCWNGSRWIVSKILKLGRKDCWESHTIPEA